MVTFEHVPNKPMADIVGITHITDGAKMHRMAGPTAPSKTENRAGPTLVTP